MKKSKRVKKSNSWKIKQHRDQFFKKSKTLGYRSRASFKLIELNKKYKFLKKNTNLLDLGSTPGSWSQVVSQIVKTGKIMSIDIKKMEPIKNVKFFKGDVLSTETKSVVIQYFKSNIDGIDIHFIHEILNKVISDNKFIYDIWVYGNFTDNISDLDLIIIYKKNPKETPLPDFASIAQSLNGDFRKIEDLEEDSTDKIDNLFLRQKIMPLIITPIKPP